MKLSGLALLAGIAVSSLAVAPAMAQRHVEVSRTVTTHTETNGGWHPEWRRHKVCRTHWYNHRKVTRCKWRRYRIN
jgi:hypothetical protein